MLKTKNQTKRLIYFIGHPNEEKSALITLICDGYETISKLLMTGECATRTLLNLYNLHVVRGNLIDGKLDLDSSMSGPHHYFGFIDPYRAYKIIIENGLPKYFEYPTSIVDDYQDIKIPESFITKIKEYNWMNGKFINQQETNHKTEKIYDKIINVNSGDLVTDSLFANPGVLKIDVDKLHFNVIKNAYNYSLSDFKAQLVKNNKPFAFSQDMINSYKHAQHKLRVITYNYGKKYVDSYLMKGSGIFIEKHEFIQSITPLNRDCGGYVILGREINYRLELIAISIPFGYTLLVEPWCIHGDSTINGLYSMAMTGNHEAMRTADTVFLKNSTGNIKCIFNDYYHDTYDYIYNKNQVPDILLTSNKLSKRELLEEDEKLKKYIKTTHGHFLGRFFQPVIMAPYKMLAWNKTLGSKID